MRTEIDGTVAFGPPRPKVTTDYTSFSTPDYLTGYARKILRDLVKVARMYNGRLLKLYRPAVPTARIQLRERFCLVIAVSAGEREKR